jgi:hypothetical protein
MRTADYNAEYFDNQYKNGSKGNLYDMEVIYYPLTTLTGDPQSPKLPQPDNVINIDFQNWGSSPEDYRWLFIQDNNADADDYSQLIALNQAFSNAGAGDMTPLSQMLDTDEHLRLRLTMEELAMLKPAFRKNGTVTAGNSSGLNDGASAAVITSRTRAKELGLKPLARIVAQTVAGVPPEIMGYGPVPAIRKLLEKTGMRLEQIGLFEINEAFASQFLVCEKELGLDRNKVNVNGGGIALGHPVGCTGLRIVISLLYEMKRRNEQYGIASLCAGGGMGMATLIELEG